ncbi:lamin Dm0-like [Ixodes scapularis]
MHVSFESQRYSIRSAHPYNDLLKIESQSANGAYTEYETYPLIGATGHVALFGGTPPSREHVAGTALQLTKFPGTVGISHVRTNSEMASRSVRKQVVTTTTTTSSSQYVSQHYRADSPANPVSPRTSRSSDTNAGGSRERSRSPLSAFRVSRIREKNELAHLNDRLAAYIDRVRHLESENSKLTEQMTSQETRTREVASVKVMYERELADARRTVNLTAIEKAKLQLDAKKWQTEAETLQTKLAKREREWSAAERRVTSLESQNVDLQGRLNQALPQLKDPESFSSSNGTTTKRSF